MQMIFYCIGLSIPLQTIRQDVDAMSDWILAHNLQFNCVQCKSMLVTGRGNPLYRLPYKSTVCLKYLRILLTSDLSWSAHVTSIYSKPRQQIGILYHRFYRYSSIEMLKRLYAALVHPHLKYAVSVWDPHLTKDINALKAVQRFACRVCTKRWGMSCSDMLNIPLLSEESTT